MGKNFQRPVKRIGVLLFDGVVALDIAGPMEAFSAAHVTDDRGAIANCYELLTVGLTNKYALAGSGLTLKPSTTLAACPRLDTLIIPGGWGLREPRTNRVIATWIKSRAKTTRRIASVCTGIYALAPTGLLDGATVTTHWRFADDVARKFPALKVEADALFRSNGHIYTSAGITAGIDLALALIEEDYGRSTALSVARELVVFMKRSGGQEQYSEPLQFQVESTDSTTEVGAYIRSHLKRDLSVEALANVAGLSYRQFSRRFKATFDCTPADYVAAVRLNEACTLLCETRCNIDQLATSVGFSSDDAFRRAFEKRFGVSPRNYRTNFGRRTLHEKQEQTRHGPSAPSLQNEVPNHVS